MPATTATLSGPTSGNGGVASSNFTVTLDAAAGVGGVVVTPASSVGGDTITTSPFTIPAGQTTGTFQVTPSTCGNRSISITTSPVLTYPGSPITYNSLCNCPDDTGSNNRVQTWGSPTVACPPTFSISTSITPFQLYAKDLYCTASVISITITE
jgi:hypothetical protein